MHWDFDRLANDLGVDACKKPFAAGRSSVSISSRHPMTFLLGQGDATAFNDGRFKYKSAVILLALVYGIACEKDPLEQEHQRHSDEAQNDDQWIGLPLDRREGAQHDHVE